MNFKLFTTTLNQKLRPTSKSLKSFIFFPSQTPLKLQIPTLKPQIPTLKNHPLPLKISPRFLLHTPPLPRIVSSPLATLFPPLTRSQRHVHAFKPNTAKPQMKPTQQQQLEEFLGKTDSRPLTRVDQAAQIALRQSEQSSKLINAGSSGKFYLISRLVFAFETWTILFFGGAFFYYIYNVLQYREDSPWDIAVRMWDNFTENSRQYRELALGKGTINDYKEDLLKDRLVQNPDDKEAKEELEKLGIKKAKKARFDEIRRKEEAQAQLEWAQLSNDLAMEQQRHDLEQMQVDFQKKVKEAEKSGEQISEADLLAFIDEHNKAKMEFELGIKSTAGKQTLTEQHLQEHQQSKRRHFQ